MEHIQKSITLSDEEAKIHVSKGGRRGWTIYDNWTYDIKANAISKLKINIEESLWNDLSDLVLQLKYQYFYNNALRVCDWPICDASLKLKEKFKVFEDDVERYVIMGQSANNHVYPHIDPVRSTAVYIPLLPRGDDYTPLELYYNNMIIGTPANNEPCVYAWNTKIPHSVFQFGMDRYNVQITFNLPYKEFFEKYKDLFDV